MALRLREETTMTLAWIARRLERGTKTHLSHLLYWQGRAKDQLMILRTDPGGATFFL
jgi:hypothetical protein